MELTKEQIQKVENYLKHKNFEYLDLKAEVLDHMISDIETKITKQISFENAFKMTVLKWNTHFKDTSSFYFGIMYFNTKIVVKKAVKIFRPFYFMYLGAYFLPIIFLNIFPIKVSISLADFINGFLLSFSCLGVFYIFYVVFKTWQLKIKTTYSFILKTQYLGVIFLIIGGMLGQVFNKQGKMDAIFTSFICVGFFIVFLIHYFFKKHQETILKYKTL